MNFILKAYAFQDIGSRSNQEDCFFPPFYDPCHFDETKRDWSYFDGMPHSDDRLFIVCDGMGGHDRGELASRIVTTSMSDHILKTAPIEGLFSDDILRDAASKAYDALLTEYIEEEEHKMGTTMALIKFHADGATVCHIGDSRVYQFRPSKDGEPAKMLFCTEDHTVVNDMLRKGSMTSEEAARSPRRHVLSRCMVARKDTPPQVEIDHITDVKTGDIFLLCSDGVYENLSNDDLCTLLCDPNCKGAGQAQRLLHHTIDNRDNHTAIIVQVEEVLNTTQDDNSTTEVLQPGTVLRSKNYTYHVEKVIGQGAFGITYLVNTGITIQGQLGNVHTDVKLAMKEFYMHGEMKRSGNDIEITAHEDKVDLFAEKFQREALKLAMLSHPNIVKVLEVFQANGTYYYTMEYLPDGSLLDYVNKRDGLPEQEALVYIRQIGYALSYLHLNKMLHLDIKPSNIMRDVATNTVKIIDFGLAKRYEDNGKAESSAMLGAGTSGYAPLEQSNDTVETEFSPQLDVYALGATYYKMLTSITPNSAIDVLNMGLKTMPLVRKHVSDQSIDAIKAAMEPSVNKRLKTVKDFLKMLPSIEDKAVSKPKKRSKWWKWLIILIVEIVVIAGIVYILT